MSPVLARNWVRRVFFSACAITLLACEDPNLPDNDASQGGDASFFDGSMVMPPPGDGDGDGDSGTNTGEGDAMTDGGGDAGDAEADADAEDMPPIDVDMCPDDDMKMVPGLCGCGESDDDSDSDEVPDCDDNCPNDPDKTAVGACGCGNADTDSDSDEVADCDDLCDDDPLKTAVGECGCGTADTDTDSDETADCHDDCPTDPLKTAGGACGCNVSDEDSDLDETPDCDDECDDDADKIAEGVCGCGYADEDTDFDEIVDCNDNCVGVPNPDQADSDGDGIGDACEACNDVDGDGYGSGVGDNADCGDSALDCDDGDARVSPGHAEVCDGVDNDCNEATDDGDPDGDGLDGCRCVWEESESSWIDITESGTHVAAFTEQDDAAVNVELPFELPYFGEAYTTLDISLNGFLAIGAHSAESSAAFFNTSMPDDEAPNAVVAPLWDDLEDDTDAAAVYYEARGETPDRSFVVTWEQISFHQELEAHTSFQAILHEDGRIEYQYRNPSASDFDRPLGRSATVGVESPDGQRAWLYSADESALHYPSRLTLVCQDACPEDPLKIEEGQCGCGERDDDTDGDLTADCFDECVEDPDKAVEGQCGCFVPDDDSDGDETADCNDDCDDDNTKVDEGVCGCGVADTDIDGDETWDCQEECPNDPSKTSEGACGCGEEDVYSDEDAEADCNDECPNDSSKIEAGTCGCNVSENLDDSDGDLVPYCLDACPEDDAKSQPGVCGCNVQDVDQDFDEIIDCVDNCPFDPNFDQDDSDGDGTGDACDMCNDADHDGYGDGSFDNDFCELSGVDCDDANERVNPRHGELCDGIDNDCNGESDDGDPDGDGEEGCLCFWQEVPATWVQRTENGVQLETLDERDDASLEIDLPFELPYFGRTYTSMVISTNGFMIAGSGGASVSGTATSSPGIPTGGHDGAMRSGIVSPFWTDLVTLGGGHIYADWQGVENDRRIVVSWENVHFYTNREATTSFQAILGEDGSVEYQYGDSDYGIDVVAGASTTIGAQASTGDIGWTWSRNEQALHHPMGLELICDDECPDDPAKLRAGTCGCGVSDIDTDGDGFVDCEDNCPSDFNPRQDDYDHDAIGNLCDTCLDVDGDGYGQAQEIFAECPNEGTDCNDLAFETNPGAAEVCDYADNDCNEAVDDGDPNEDGIEGCGCGFLPGEAEWIDISESGTQLVFDDAEWSWDDGAETIALGFDMPYFGNSYDSAQVSTNGFIMMGTSSVSATHTSGPHMPYPGEPNNVLAALWDDLAVNSGGVLYETRGEAPNRTTIVSWLDVPFLSTETYVSFQIVMHEDGAIEYQYLNASDPADYQAMGGNATIGIENVTGYEGATYSYQEASLSYPSKLTWVCTDMCPENPNKLNPGACGCNLYEIYVEGELVECSEVPPRGPIKEIDFGGEGGSGL